MMLNKIGVPSKEQIESKFPTRQLLIKPKAIIECYEDIPCNPCSTACPFDAIYIGKNINDIPQLDIEKCTGCAICVPSCPGLAIIIAQVKEDQAIFKIPYEMLPKPKPNEVWHGVDRHGKIICDAHIDKVLVNNKQDHTTLVTVFVPIDYLYDFVTIREKKDER